MGVKILTTSGIQTKIVALRGLLLPDLQERITRFLFEWRVNDEKHWFENLVWRACDSYGKKELDCRFLWVNGSATEYFKLWNVLGPISQDESKWTEFQHKYFEPELVRREEPTEHVLLRRFIGSLSNETTDLLAKLFKRLGGYYMVWDANEKGETTRVQAADFHLIHPDAGEAVKEKLSARAMELDKEASENAKRILAEMYSPFLQLRLESRRKLVDASPEAFKRWEQEHFREYLEKKIKGDIEQELIDAGVAVGVEQESVKGAKLNLNPKDSTDLNAEIVKVIGEYIEGGEHSLDECYRLASENSQKHFEKWLKLVGLQRLTMSTIKGRYERNQGKNL